MSLDVTLRMEGFKIAKYSSGIFVRRDGQTKEISEDEWYRMNPGQEPARMTSENIETDEVFSANITHNLGIMAREAGIYNVMWRPEEIGITKAVQLIDPLLQGLKLLREKPEYFKTFNPENGWGTYEQLVRVVKDYLIASINYPEAEVQADR